MKRNDAFLLSDVAGTHVLVPTGKRVADFSRMVTLNDFGAEIWGRLAADTTPDALADAVCVEFDVPKPQAEADINEFLQTLRDAGCLAEG